MNCAKCGCESPERAKFCLECGAAIAARCASCGTELPPAAKFCLECSAATTATSHRSKAESQTDPRPLNPDPRAYTPKHLADKILQSKSALEGERKQVTVLFADVKGSMELAEQLDPEQWHTILDRFFQILTEGVHRFEGTVNQYTGDGIMALFGAPIAHEDHAQRACYAALHLRDALKGYADELRRTSGVSLSTRIGINSGEVVVGRIGDDLRMDYTAQGHTVGLAQRMESRAAADSTYLTAHTARLVEGYFQLRDLGEFDLKGVSAPLRAYELQGVGSLRTRLDISRARGFSKFVGREREMATLKGALDAAIGGQGQVVGVVADAGTGKSRLCLEFVERCRARGVRVNEGHCPAHGKTIPHLPLLEMLRDIFGIAERDTDHEARRKIAGELLLLDDAFQELLPILFDFMGVADPSRPAPAMSPEGRQQKLFAFVRHLTEARSVREPTVLFLDDLHWIDPGSDAFLAHSIAAVQNTRTLWLVNFRPEYGADWMRKAYYQQIPLLPLGPEATRELLADLLGSDPSVAGLSAYVHRRTGGNPFFIEEVVQSLLESGRLTGAHGAYRLVGSVEAVEIPATVQTVLAARIDRLGDDEKRTLQTASVIGKEFSGAILAAVVAADEGGRLSSPRLAAALNTLRAGEFVYETALYPEVEYAFKHPLTQEVAYRSQLGARRAQVHAAVARATEQRHATKLDERAALLAYHWEQAGDALTASQWYARAARVAGFDSPVEAVRHWEKVWGILQSAPSFDAGVALRREATSQLLLFGWRLGMTSERVAEIFAEGKALAVAAGDVREQVRLHYSLGLIHALDGSPRRAIPIFEESVVLADATGDPELRWSARTAFDFSLWLFGDLVAAQRMNAEQIALGEVDPALGIATIGICTADSLWHCGVILTDLGRFQEAAEALRRADERARRFGGNEMASWIDFWSARNLSRAGDPSGAQSMGRRAIESAEKIGSVLGRVGAYGHYGMACVLAKEWQSARENLELALDLGRANQAGRFLDAYYLAALAEAHLGLGDEPRARALVEEAIETAVRMQMRVAEVRAQLALARVRRAIDEAGASVAIAAALDHAQALVQSTGARSYEPQIYVERARLAALRADASEAQQWLREAHRLFTEMGATGYAERLAQELGS
ncbi:MAG: AAA family ATPase [Deltaproteobacteria bacterium]|nr:AAA family ATPase [Deltaproteobacteria bacterium]MBI3386363.1 AAA family ATPase [Deltaproteobacteria bacterium]